MISEPEPEIEPEVDPEPEPAADLVAKAEPEPAITKTTEPEPEPAVTQEDPPATPPAQPVRPVSTTKAGWLEPRPIRSSSNRSSAVAATVATVRKNRKVTCASTLRRESAPAVNPDRSSSLAIPTRATFYELISLPEDDDDIMPPKGKPLSAAQISWIGGWIREGAALGDGVAWPVEEGAPTGLAIDALAGGIGAPDAAATQRLLDGGVIVRKLSTDGKLLEIDFSHADRPAGGMNLDELAPLAANIHTLDLKRTRISDADLKVVGTMANLRIPPPPAHQSFRRRHQTPVIA